MVKTISKLLVFFLLAFFFSCFNTQEELSADEQQALTNEALGIALNAVGTSLDSIDWSKATKEAAKEDSKTSFDVLKDDVFGITATLDLSSMALILTFDKFVVGGGATISGALVMALSNEKIDCNDQGKECSYHTVVTINTDANNPLVANKKWDNSSDLVNIPIQVKDVIFCIDTSDMFKFDWSTLKLELAPARMCGFGGKIVVYVQVPNIGEFAATMTLGGQESTFCNDLRGIVNGHDWGVFSLVKKFWLAVIDGICND
ncbi:MAG: hypothetical protein GY754_28950 [bacterium]|nr:hypothetical protein [bacterium]